MAATKGLDFQIVTFWPHPREIFGGIGSHKPLSSRAERLCLLRQAKASQIHEIPFTPELAALSPEQFVNRHLLPLGMTELVVGHDFALGRAREGNIRVLRALGEKCGFGVTQAEAFEIDGGPVSSTRLRESLARGEIRKSTQMLGRNYAIGGKIAHGEKRGAALGFPTANLEEIKEVVPANGVYATRAIVGGKEYPGLTNIGANPTFNGKRRTIETFLLDCSGDLYGEEMRLVFIDRLREERKFDSPASLVQQIRNDIEKARSLPEFNERP